MTKLGYVYDYLGRRTGVKNRTGTADNYRYTWTYAGDDTVRQHRDGVNGKKYRYDYDSIGRLNRFDVFNNSTDAYIGSSQFGYDKRNNLTSVALAMDGKICTQKYYYSPISGLSATTGYAKDNLPTRYQISSASHVDYSYDVIERLTQKSLTTGSASLNTDYTYKASARGGNYTTHLIETELLANDGYQYTYNLMGNITAVKKGTRANMSALSDYRAYTYDAKGELTGETIYSGGSSTQRAYAYDGLGNITSQTQTGALGNKSISYTYGTSSSAGWGKMLNSVSIPSLLK